MNYAIVFSLDTLIKDNEPNGGACTVYNLVLMQAQLVGHAIKTGGLPDSMIFVDIIADRPETDREKIMEQLKFADIELPRALRLGQDDIGNDQILAVFDDDPKRVEMWRAVGATCFSAKEAPRIALPGVMRIGA